MLANWHYLFFVASWFIVVAGLVTYRFFKVRKNMGMLVASRYKKNLLRNWSLPRFIVKNILLLAALFFLALALLRPQGDPQEEQLPSQGRNLIIALDISRSMLAQDCQPNRLDCAKEKILKLVQELACDRVGLILFSGTAVVMCPLTNDHEAFALFLREVDVETISAGTTAMDQALRKIISLFDTLPECKHKLALIVTDGEDFSSSLSSAKEEVIKRDIHMITLGMGTGEGAPIPVYDATGRQQGHLKDDNHQIIISRLNEPILQALARDSAALYVRATANDSDVATMASWVHSFEQEEGSANKKVVMSEYYWYPAAISLLLLALEWIL
jgi:Ca-activated chloride channel family protein